MNTPWIIIAGVAIMLVMAISIILFTLLYQRKTFKQKEVLQQKELEYQFKLIGASLAAQEKERTSIAKDLHDELGALLNTSKLNLKAYQLNTDENKKHELIDRTSHLIQETIDHVRLLSRDLLPPTLDKLGLFSALEELFVRNSRAGDIRIEFNRRCKSIELTKNKALQVYRIVQEILVNILKHAGATVIQADAEKRLDELCICICHDGEGIAQTEVKRLINDSKTVGLTSIQSRAYSINAKVQYTVSDQKAGVEIIVPI
jgi:signal transduction histidine kinase